MDNTTLVCEYSFNRMDGTPRVQGEVRVDADNIYYLHDGEVDHFLPKASALQALQARGYHKLNKYGKIQYNFLKAEAS